MVTDTEILRPQARSAVHLSPRLRQHRRAVARWALAQGRPLNIDAITVILAVREFEADTDGAPFTRWTTQGLIGFLWGSAISWCDSREIDVPPGLNESLWSYLSYLGAERELASGSASLAALREVLVETGGLSRSGRARVTRGARLATTWRLDHRRAQ